MALESLTASANTATGPRSITTFVRPVDFPMTLRSTATNPLSPSHSRRRFAGAGRDATGALRPCAALIRAPRPTAADLVAGEILDLCPVDPRGWSGESGTDRGFLAGSVGLNFVPARLDHVTPGGLSRAE